MATAVVDAPMTAEMSPSVKKALTTAERAKALTVTSIETRNDAAELGRAIVQLDKEVEEFFKPMKESAWNTHKEICAKENKVRDPLDQAKRHLSRQIGEFDAEKERERRAEEARLQEEERLKAIADAEKVAQDQAIADAIALEAEGDKAGAEAVLNHPAPVPVHVPSVVLQSSVPKVAGVSTRKTWKFRITKPEEVKRDFLMPDEKNIASVVKAMGLKAAAVVGGIEVYEENGASFRA